MEQVHEGRIDQVMKPAIKTLVYRRRKRNSMSFGEKIGLVYENCEVLRYKVGRMEDYLGIERVSFTQLEEGSIDNFKQLSTAFSKQYGYFIKSDIIEAQVWNLPQSADDPLRSYITTFKEIMVQIPGLSDSAAQFALKNGLWHESRFRESLTVNRPETIQDALH